MAKDYLLTAILCGATIPFSIFRSIKAGEFVFGIELFILLFGLIAIYVGGAYEPDKED